MVLPSSQLRYGALMAIHCLVKENKDEEYLAGHTPYPNNPLNTIDLKKAIEDHFKNTTKEKILENLKKIR